MKLKINGRYQEVDFWSFVKCYLFSWITVSAIFLAAFLILDSIL